MDGTDVNLDNSNKTPEDAKRGSGSKARIMTAGIAGLSLILAGAFYGVHRHNVAQAEERSQAESALEVAVGVAAGTVAYGEKLSSFEISDNLATRIETVGYAELRDKVKETLKNIPYVEAETADLSGEPLVGDPYGETTKAPKPGVVAAHNDLNFGVFKAKSKASNEVTTDDMVELTKVLKTQTKALAEEISSLAKSVEGAEVSTAETL